MASKVQLNLTEKQARVLYVVLAHVGGFPEGPRGQVDKIFNRLQSQLGGRIWDNGLLHTQQYIGGIQLRDEPY